MAESEDIRPAIGIDLGTTNCRVGIWLDEKNRFELISNDHGHQSTPSYVAFTETERLIGDSAKDQVSRNPANTVFDAKRLIGRKFSDLGTDSDKMHIQWPFRVARGVDEKPMIHVEYKGKEKVFSAEEVYSMILGKMKDLAEVYSGSVVNGASVSVPHCFNSAQRQATRNACSMAGLETVTLVNEPICAALAYTLNTSRESLGEKKVMIFDLGGGSLDVTLFSIEEGVIEVKATSGDSQLGGEDFDLRLLHHFIQEIKQKYERDISSHPRVVRRLKKQVERVKLALSSEMETSIQIDSLLEDFNFYSSVSRACFEEMNMDLFGKCIKCVEECLQGAELDKADVYEVVLIGGSSRIPKVQELLAEFFNDKAKLNTSINPDEAVVCGAAARSGISLGYKAFADYLVVDVTPMSLGLEAVGGAMHVMHPRNSSIPKSSEQLFTTVHDDQPGIFIQVYEGENSQTCDNMLIATIELSEIPPAPRGIPQILVRFDVDAYGILAASAKDKTTGQKVELYMEEVDIASSIVHHDDERCQRLPIQVYHPSLPFENPNDPSSLSGPHESNNASESSPHEFSEPSPSSIAMESSPKEFCELPQPYESSNIVESISQEFSEPSPAYESSNTVESSSQEFSEPSPAYESSNTVESGSQEFYEPPQAFESSNTIENSSQPPLVESRSLEFPEPPQVHESNSTLESRFKEFSEAPPAYERSNAMENRSQESSELLQAYEANNAVENRSQELSEPPQAYESSNAVENRSQEFLEQPQSFGLSNAMESRSQEPSVLSPAFKSSKDLEENTMEIRSEEFSGPPQAYGEIRSEEFCEPSQASGSSNAINSRSQDFSAPQADDISNAVESSLQISLVQKIIETVHVIAPISDFKTHKRECSTFIRRVNMLAPLFGEFRDLELSLSEEVLACFSSLEAALNRAKDLLLLCSKGSKLWLILEQERVAEQFLLLNSALVEALDKLPDSLGISDEVQEQVDLVHNQLRRSKGLEDAVDAQLNVELIPVLDETNERSPDQLTRLAELFKFDTESALRKESQALDGMTMQKERLVPFLVSTRGFDQIFGLLNNLRNLFPSEDQEQHKYSKPPQAYGSSNVVESSSQEFSAPPPLPHKSGNSLEDRSPEYSEPPQVYRDVESRSQEFSAPPPPPAYNSSHSMEGRHPSKHSEGFLEYSGPPQVHRDVESRPRDVESRLRDVESSPIDVESRPRDVESRSQEFSASPPPPQAYNSSHSLEGRSLEYSGAPQVPRDVESRSQEFSAPPPPPQAYNSSNSSEGRSREFSESPQVHRDVVSRSQEYSVPPSAYKSSHSFEGRPPHEYTEAPPVYRPSKTFGGRQHEFSEPGPTHRSSSTSQSRSQEFPEYSSRPEFPEHSPSKAHIDNEAAYKAGNGLEGKPPEGSEPLSTHRLSSSSGSRRHDPFELSPVCKSSNASESRRHESSEQSPSWKSSSTSEMSSEEFSGSGPLRAQGGMEHPVSDLPELHRAATLPDEPLNHNRRRAENARSASCPQIRTSDTFIEDVVKKYTWDEVLDMTNDLTYRQLGKGGFGAVYLGKLENEKEVAVKILDPSSQQGISEFLNEVNLLKRVNHTNLVRLLGYCLDERQVLIYEFAEEGSIWDHLQVGGKSIDWKQRLNIALQSACGLEYLHTGCSPRIIHRDIKSQNILLTKSMVAKVADFGLSKLGADQDNISKTHVTTMVKGTLGYLDPEYLKTGQLTEKSDVYSFGVVLLEIITGRKPIQNSDNQKIQKCFIGDWVEEHYSSSSSSSRGLRAVADPALGGLYDPKALKLVVNIAKYCTQPSGAGRPEMTEVVRVLRKALKIENDEKKSSKWLPFR